MHSFWSVLMMLLPVMAPPTRLADIGPAPALFSLTPQASLRLGLIERQSGGRVIRLHDVYRRMPSDHSVTEPHSKSSREGGLWGKSVEFVSISLDPDRDTSDVLTRYARLFKTDLSNWHFLTGTRSEVQSVITAWGMWAKIGPTGVLDHPSRIFLLDKQGRQREIYNLEFLKERNRSSGCGGVARRSSKK